MSEITILVLDVIRRLASFDASARQLAADEVTDILHSLGTAGPALAGVLAVVRLTEEDKGAQEAELHALAEMHEWGLVPVQIRELLATLALDETDHSQEEYLDYLLDRQE